MTSNSNCTTRTVYWNPNLNAEPFAGNATEEGGNFFEVAEQKISVQEEIVLGGRSREEVPQVETHNAKFESNHTSRAIYLPTLACRPPTAAIFEKM